jgi:hypothetical protein
MRFLAAGLPPENSITGAIRVGRTRKETRKSLMNMVGTRRLELLTSTVSKAVSYLTTTTYRLLETAQERGNTRKADSFTGEKLPVRKSRVRPFFRNITLTSVGTRLACPGTLASSTSPPIQAFFRMIDYSKLVQATRHMCGNFQLDIERFSFADNERSHNSGRRNIVRHGSS